MSAGTLTSQAAERRSARDYISKSFVAQVEACGQKAWRSIHDPRPWVAPEKVTFGSAIDSGVESIIKALRDGSEPDLELAQHEAMLRVDGETNPPDPAEVATALRRFAEWSVVHEVAWAGAVLQAHLRLELSGIGPVDAHPDLLLASGDRIGCVVDVKASSRAKPANAAATSYTELGLYALLVEADTGRAPDSVAYWTYARTARPWWQEVRADVTFAMLRGAQSRVAAVARAIEADALLNDGVAHPTNSVFVTGPRYGCGDCQYRDDCDWREEEPTDA